MFHCYEPTDLNLDHLAIYTVTYVSWQAIFAAIIAILASVASCKQHHAQIVPCPSHNEVSDVTTQKWHYPPGNHHASHL